MLLPFAPFLYAQGKYTRWKVGRLPDAGGEIIGRVNGSGEVRRMLALGESTVAGIGADVHSEAFTGQFAKHLSLNTGFSVEWYAAGVSGITVRRSIDELLPTIVPDDFDIVVVALGGNDVFNIHSPEKFRSDFIELLIKLREKNPRSVIFVANVPMVKDFRALPNPLRFILSRLAKSHHFNAGEIVSNFENAYYYDDIGEVEDDFFSDGIHPSANGYNLWCEAMVKFFLSRHSEI